MPHPHLPLCFNFTLYVCVKFWTSMCQRCWCSPTRHTTSVLKFTYNLNFGLDITSVCHLSFSRRKETAGDCMLEFTMPGWSLCGHWSQHIYFFQLGCKYLSSFSLQSITNGISKTAQVLRATSTRRLHSFKFTLVNKTQRSLAAVRCVGRHFQICTKFCTRSQTKDHGHWSGSKTV